MPLCRYFHNFAVFIFRVFKITNCCICNQTALCTNSIFCFTCHRTFLSLNIATTWTTKFNLTGIVFWPCEFCFSIAMPFGWNFYFLCICIVLSFESILCCINCSSCFGACWICSFKDHPTFLIFCFTTIYTRVYNDTRIVIIPGKLGFTIDMFLRCWNFCRIWFITTPNTMMRLTSRFSTGRFFICCPLIRIFMPQRHNCFSFSFPTQTTCKGFYSSLYTCRFCCNRPRIPVVCTIYLKFSSILFCITLSCRIFITTYHCFWKRIFTIINTAFCV